MLVAAHRRPHGPSFLSVLIKSEIKIKLGSRVCSGRVWIYGRASIEAMMLMTIMDCKARGVGHSRGNAAALLCRQAKECAMLQEA